MGIRVCIVSVRSVVRSSMRAILEAEEDISVIGEREEIERGREQVSGDKPDVVIWESGASIDVIKSRLSKLRGEEFSIPILFISTRANEDQISKILEAGVSGYLLKKNTLGSLVEAVRALARGECWFSPHISELATPADECEHTPELTEREVEVLQMMAWGLSNQEIAERLNITIRTVKFHAGNIYQKLDVTSRAEAIASAWRQGIVNDSGEDDTR